MTRAKSLTDRIRAANVVTFRLPFGAVVSAEEVIRLLPTADALDLDWVERAMQEAEEEEAAK